MKTTSITFTSLFIMGIFALSASTITTQKKISRPQTSSCCTDRPFKLTIAAEGMMEQFGKLVAKSGIVRCNKIVNSLTSAMPAEYVLAGTNKGIITYAVFFKPDGPYDGNEGPDRLRVAWASVASEYNHYGACIPNPIVYPAEQGYPQNSVYGVKFVPIAQYKVSRDKDNINNIKGYPINQIRRIENVYLESQNGYMATQEKDRFNNPKSSKGVVAVVRSITGQLIKCYVMNNGENGQLIWKQANNCAGL